MGKRRKPLKWRSFITAQGRIQNDPKKNTFIETQQDGNKIKSFLRQNEMCTLRNDCQAGVIHCEWHTKHSSGQCNPWELAVAVCALAVILYVIPPLLMLWTFVSIFLCAYISASQLDDTLLSLPLSVEIPIVISVWTFIYLYYMQPTSCALIFQWIYLFPTVWRLPITWVQEAAGSNHLPRR